MNPKISIVVPIYNVERYLRQCIDSILAQTLSDFELILVNDGSPDNCGEICDEYAKKDNRVIVIHKKNCGVSSARNVGIESSKSEYIAFVDPDDTIEPTMYEALYLSATTHDADIIVCPIRKINLINNHISTSSIFGEVNSPINSKTIADIIIPDLLSKKYYSLLSSINKLYKTDFIKKLNHKFNEKMHHGEDARFNIILLTKINRLVFIEEPLYNYYVRSRNSLTQRFNENLYAYILDNKNFGLYLANKFNIQNYIPNLINDYVINSLNFMQEIVYSNLPRNKKLNLLSEIMKDKDFEREVVNCQCPSIFYKLLKKISIERKEYHFIYAVNTKKKIKLFIDKVIVHESK